MKRYKQVERKPLTDPDFDDEGESSQTKAWLEYAWRKLNAVLWISVACAIGYLIKLPDVLLTGYVPGRPEKQLNWFFFKIALAGFCGWLCVAAYLIVWLKYVKKISEEWEQHSPRAIPIATVCAVCSLIAFCVAFWPIWSGFSLPIVFFLFLGALNTAHFVPL